MKSKSIFGLKPLDIAIVTLVAVHLLLGVLLVHEKFFTSKSKAPLNPSTTVVSAPGASAAGKTSGNDDAMHRFDPQR